MNNIWVLAQTAEETSSGITSESVTAEKTTTTTVVADSNAPVAPQPAQKNFTSPLFLFGLMLVLFYLLLFRGPRKKQQEQKKMVQSLEKNDKVRTIGGIIGTVVDINGDVITLKVDESNNTKIKVISSAIGKNLSKDKGGGD
jgi:preprotein translocase subunit YajC